MRRSFACLALSTLLLAGPAVAQDARPRGPEALIEKSVKDLARGRVGAAVKDDVKALQRGPLLIHGNYCGVGNRPGSVPIDALDAACMRHDACTTTGKLPNCTCDDRLRAEASEIAADPRTPPDLKAMAATTATAMAVLICKTGPAAMPAAVRTDAARTAPPAPTTPRDDIPPRDEIAPGNEIAPAR